MTEQEYIESIQAVQKLFEFNKSQIAKEYALSNNPYPVGSIISDHMKTIKINKIKVYIGNLGSLPQCIYEGDNLLKNGTISKKDPIGTIYQQNIGKPKNP